MQFVGAASNQLVLVANHDRFPVMVNARKLREFEKRDRESSTVQAIASLRGIAPPVPSPNDDDGMIDDTHCVMTKDTRLNFLADWIDLHPAIYSPGDLLMDFGDFLGNYSFIFWLALVLNNFSRRTV